MKKIIFVILTILTTSIGFSNFQDDWRFNDIKLVFQENGVKFRYEDFYTKCLNGELFILHKKYLNIALPAIDSNDEIVKCQEENK